MDFYALVKLVHVVAAVAWVGGGLTMTAQAIFAIRDKGQMAALEAVGSIGSMARRWFIPASLLTVISGLTVTTIGGLWSELWVVLGLVGFASTFLTGILVFEPMSKKIVELRDAGNTTAALAEGLSMLQVVKFDYTIIMLVIADMVLKPSLNDYPVLIAFVVIGVVAAGLFLRPIRRSAPRAA